MKRCNADCWCRLLSKQKRFLSIILVNMILVASSYAGLYKPSKSDETPNANLTELQIGRKLYVNNCASCHALYEPERYDTAHWKKWMDKMAPKARISNQNKALILKYVTKGKK